MKSGRKPRRAERNCRASSHLRDTTGKIRRLFRLERRPIRLHTVRYIYSERAYRSGYAPDLRQAKPTRNLAQMFLSAESERLIINLFEAAETAVISPPNNPLRRETAAASRQR